MSDALQILLIGIGALVALIVLTMVVSPFRSYWEGLFGNFGEYHAARLREWWRTRKARSACDEGATRSSPAVPGQVALEAVPSPAIIAVGADARRIAAGRAAAAIDSTEGGALIARVGAAVDQAAAAVRSGAADTIAVVLSMPLSGSWAGDASLDLARLFASIFRHRDCPVWLAYEEPIDVSSWPEEVFLETPDSPEQLIERLCEAGLAELRVTPPVVIGRSLRLGRELAARALLLLTAEGEQRGRTPPILPAASVRPNYASFIALGLRSGTALDSQGRSERNQEVAIDLQRAMQEGGIRLIGVPPGGASGLLPLTPYRGQLVSWRPATIASPEPIAAAAMERLQHTAQGVEDLERALREGDTIQAAETLATFGRAWIETSEAPYYRDLLERVCRGFDESSEVALWARYLVALDAALRESQPHKSWFDGRACELAARHGALGLLYRAERMEFTRLQEDLPGAVRLASQLAAQLKDPRVSKGVGQVYASATAHFVLANVLRAGGRYDLARRHVVLAGGAYDPRYPSHAVEAMHCRYALAVCDAIDGVPHVEQLSDVDAGQLVFARSLVTLTNSQAAWFVNDLQRATQFARDARDGFRSIGYERHAGRAQRLTALFELWTDLRDDKAPRAPESFVVSCVMDAVRPTREPLDLRDLRPSAALAVLQFAVTFVPDPSVHREVSLPAVIQSDTEYRLELVRPQPALSPAQANSDLRQLMGVGQDCAVPLLPD